MTVQRAANYCVCVEKALFTLHEEWLGDTILHNINIEVLEFVS